MIARVLERRVPEGPGTRRPTGSFPRQWAEIAGGGGPGARAVLRVRVANCLSRDPAWAVREVWATQALALRPTRTGRTYRLVVSFHPGERPSGAVLDDIEETLVAAAGFAGHQRLSALQELEDDSGRWRLQVAVSKVHPATRKTVTPFYDRRRLMAACAALEAKHGLVPDHHRGGAGVTDAPEPVQAVDGPGAGSGTARAGPGTRGRPRGDERDGPPQAPEEPPPDRDPDL